MNRKINIRMPVNTFRIVAETLGYFSGDAIVNRSEDMVSFVTSTLHSGVEIIYRADKNYIDSINNERIPISCAIDLDLISENIPEHEDIELEITPESVSLFQSGTEHGLYVEIPNFENVDPIKLPGSSITQKAVVRGDILAGIISMCERVASRIEFLFDKNSFNVQSHGEFGEKIDVIFPQDEYVDEHADEKRMIFDGTMYTQQIRFALRFFKTSPVSIYFTEDGFVVFEFDKNGLSFKWWSKSSEVA